MKTFSNNYSVKVAAIHMLRVNLLSLIAESRAIRREERRAGIIYRDMLHEHRVMKVREELRVTGLALAFVRGRKYRQCERSTNSVPDAKAIADKVNKIAGFGKQYCCWRGLYGDAATATYESMVCTRETVRQWILAE